MLWLKRSWALSVVFIFLLSGCTSDEPLTPQDPESEAECIDYDNHLHIAASLRLYGGAKAISVLGDYAYLAGGEGLQVVVSVRPVGDTDLVPAGTRSVSVFLVNHREPAPDMARDAAYVFQAELSLQEAQHVLAVDYGYANWNWLRTVVEVDFDLLARLTDREIQTLMREVDQKDLVVALKQPESDDELAVRDHLFKGMTERVRTFLGQEMEYLGPMPANEIEEVQQRVPGHRGEIPCSGRKTRVKIAAIVGVIGAPAGVHNHDCATRRQACKHSSGEVLP